MNDEQAFFAPQPIQRTLYQEDVCKPGWIPPIDEPPAAPLYVPGTSHVPGWMADLFPGLNYDHKGE